MYTHHSKFVFSFLQWSSRHQLTFDVTLHNYGNPKTTTIHGNDTAITTTYVHTILDVISTSKKKKQLTNEHTSNLVYFYT